MSLKRKAFCGFLRALTEASKDRFSQEVKDRVLPVLETVGTTVNALAPGKSAAAVGASTFVQGVITIDDDPVLPCKTDEGIAEAISENFNEIQRIQRIERHLLQSARRTF